jgi:aspartate aminotransferase-like enzyme
VPLETDAWGSTSSPASQKALMTPPGLAIVAVSDAALGPPSDSARASTSTGSARAQAHAAGRLAVHARRLARRALDVALGLLLDEGLEAASSGTSASAAPAARA